MIFYATNNPIPKQTILKKPVMRYLFFLLLTCTIGTLSAQSLFRYGSNEVDKSEFWRAYSKNNTETANETSLRDYLDLYIRFKLKVQAAKDLKMDTLTNIKSDVAGFRAQIAEQYVQQENFNKEMVAEAFNRAKTELEIGQIFIAYQADSASAGVQIDKAYRELQSGADFGLTSRTYSNNDYVKGKDGYIGFVSAFSLPYAFENLIYGLTPGNYSAPIAGKNGWHIFKLLSKRASTGTMKAAQILIALPSNASQEEKTQYRQKADSVYQLVSNGMDFTEAAEQFSNDKLTFMSGGVLPEFTYTRYTPEFSKAAFSLQKDGAISTPVETSSGWHIIKRLSMNTSEEKLSDPAVFQNWNEKVISSDRYKILVQQRKDKFKEASGFKLLPYNAEQLWILTDTMLLAKNYTSFYKSNQQKFLIQLKDKKITVTDWLKFAKNRASLPTEVDRRPLPELFNEFIDATVEQYYKDRLENMNEDFRYQVKEFTEGSLLFEIMEQKIWSLAPTDSVGLLNYYNQNKSKYKWQPSVAALIINCADTGYAREARELIKENPMQWPEKLRDLQGNVMGDSGRFEFTQLPVKEGTRFTRNTFTPTEVNTNDGTASFCYIFEVYATEDQRKFEDAKGLVINDYQNLLEEKWITELKKRYPVKINEAVFKSMIK
jgi:peptidyl-prolyl cis-trans isomerase SurA